MPYPEELSLWPHQQQAAEVIGRYLDRRPGGARRATPSALVNVPTGGGKTSIIAAAAHWHTAGAGILVLAPRKAIRTQLALELAAKRGHLRNCGFEPDALPKRVLELRGASDLPAQIPEATIVVATIQLLNEMHGKPSFDRLARACQVVFVDEGHYEPATSWSATIRDLKRPVILVTATPYRNDLKSFSFDNDAIHVTRYEDLRKLNVLRTVKVANVAPNVAGDPRSFVNAVMDSFEREFGSLPSAERKLIIRCRSDDDINQIGEVLRGDLRYAAGGVITLHETFPNDPARPWRMKQPPDPEDASRPATWVHQHKLLEGVDGPSFRAVAFYGTLGSDRALVQQIGRVVRNPGREPNQSALLIDHTGGAIQRRWEAYLEYDSTITSALVLKGVEEAYARLEASAPPVSYVERQFRKKLQLFATGEPDIRRSLRVPLRCQIVGKGAVTIQTVLEGQQERFFEAGWPHRIVSTTEDELILLYTTLGASPLLREHHFMQQKLQLVIARLVGDHLIFLDTGRGGLDEKTRRVIAGAVPRDALARVLSQSGDLRVLAVNAVNAAMGPSAIRRRSLSAASLEGTPPLLDEFQFVASNVKMAGRPDFAARRPDEEPRPDQFHRREVGFAKSRITDTGTRRTLANWTAWSTALSQAITDAAQTTPTYLDRFASPLATPPPASAARGMLLDFDGFDDNWIVAPNALGIQEEEPLLLGDTFLKCHKTANQPDVRRWRIMANGVEIKGTVTFTGLGYRLDSPTLSSLYRRSDGLGLDLVGEINHRQAFTIVPDEPNVIYASGDFYNPKLRLGAAFNASALGLDGLLKDLPALRLCTTEKGKGPGPDGWAVGSVFEWIDSNIDYLLPGADLVVCDDGSHETCDFLISGERNGRNVVILVHAKASAKSAWVAAGALHEVCGQASKQMGALSLFAPQRPSAVGSWTGSWKDTRDMAGEVTHRIRRANGAFAGLDGAEIWSEIAKRLARQDTEREVVLVLGATLNEAKLLRKAGKPHRPAAAVHAIHLLRSTAAAVVGGGARLRVICG